MGKINNPIFYCNVEKNEFNSELISQVEELANQDANFQCYIVNSLLGDKYTYPNSEKFLVILSPKHKLLFIDLLNNSEVFEDFYEDFIEDLNSISDKYNYKNYIGRPREWKENLTIKTSNLNIREVLDENIIEQKDQRKVELLISLVIGSINDILKVGVEEPKTILEKVKKNIILFDAEQTRFIYKDFPNKSVSIQGLSGTGKTELLLHKLKELYTSDESNKIFFTCHNIALANTLKSRIPEFFNFMKVEKQIEWNKFLWVDRAWGSERDNNSGLYSYICDFYSIPFLKFSPITNYQKIFTKALEHINNIPENQFGFAFDYILVDERQDFPDVFFTLCEKIVKKKVFIAGDIFQDIYENTKETELEVDVILNRCYRTDPRTLMFAHSMGLGLFETKKLNWLEDDYWNALGYNLTRERDEIILKREPIRRFENLQAEKIKSIEIIPNTNTKTVNSIIKNLINDHPSIEAKDIAIIILDDNKAVYEYIDRLSISIMQEFSWSLNRAYETKEKKDGEIYVTNPNNVKGLEFPFVICITNSIKANYKYRNVLYTMLTRSFIQSYLLITNPENIERIETGLKTINLENCIKTLEPSETEKINIQKDIIRFNETKNISYHDFLNTIFDELGIPEPKRKKFGDAILQADIEKFNTDETKRFISVNKEFYLK